MVIMSGFLGLWQRALGVTRFGGLLCILLVVSVSLNVILASRLRHQPPSRKLETGDAVGQLEGEVVVEKERRPYQYEVHGEKETLVYFSSDRCKWSKQNLPTFVELARQVEGKYRVVVVDVTPGQIGETSHLDVVPAEVVLHNITPATLQTYKVTGTPLTVLVSRDGKVVRSWSGAYIGKTQQDVSAYFRIQFTNP